jgi:Serpin (serine protease inhibitor)
VDFREWAHGLFTKKKEQCFDNSLLEQPMRAKETRSLAKDHNEYALASYRRLLHRPDNLFFSHFSIRPALSMTHDGERGKTAAQMRLALRFAFSDQSLHVAFAEIITHLNAAGDGKRNIVVANSLWDQDGSPPQPGFLDLGARHYGGVAPSSGNLAGANSPLFRNIAKSVPPFSPVSGNARATVSSKPRKGRMV